MNWRTRRPTISRAKAIRFTCRRYSKLLKKLFSERQQQKCRPWPCSAIDWADVKRARDGRHFPLAVKFIFFTCTNCPGRIFSLSRYTRLFSCFYCLRDLLNRKCHFHCWIHCRRHSTRSKVNPWRFRFNLTEFVFRLEQCGHSDSLTCVLGSLLRVVSRTRPLDDSEGGRYWNESRCIINGLRRSIAPEGATGGMHAKLSTGARAQTLERGLPSSRGWMEPHRAVGCPVQRKGRVSGLRQPLFTPSNMLRLWQSCFVRWDESANLFGVSAPEYPHEASRRRIHRRLTSGWRKENAPALRESSQRTAVWCRRQFHVLDGPSTWRTAGGKHFHCQLELDLADPWNNTLTDRLSAPGDLFSGPMQV